MLLVAAAIALLGLLVWMGRRPAQGRSLDRLLSGLSSVLLAAAAVYIALRGEWIVSLVCVGLAMWMGRNTAVDRPESVDMSRPKLTDREARDILGVGEDAGRLEITAAYRRLMTRAHPDHGGSTGLAAQLNAARDRLLKPPPR